LTNFQDKYSAWPGDLTTSTSKIVGCTNANNCYDGNGDAYIGIAHNLEGTYVEDYTPAIDDEPTQFWRQLMLANYIQGLVQSGDISWGDSHPASPFQGGIFVVYAREEFTNQITGNLFHIRTPLVGQQLMTYWKAGGHHPLKAKWAKFIDVKMDDGHGSKGLIEAFPEDYSCGDVDGRSQGPTGRFGQLRSPADGSPDGYNEKDGRNDCNIMFKISL